MNLLYSSDLYKRSLSHLSPKAYDTITSNKQIEYLTKGELHHKYQWIWDPQQTIRKSVTHLYLLCDVGVAYNFNAHRSLRHIHMYPPEDTSLVPIVHKNVRIGLFNIGENTAEFRKMLMENGFDVVEGLDPLAFALCPDISHVHTFNMFDDLDTEKLSAQSLWTIRIAGKGKSLPHCLDRSWPDVHVCMIDCGNGSFAGIVHSLLKHLPNLRWLGIRGKRHLVYQNRKKKPIHLPTTVKKYCTHLERLDIMVEKGLSLMDDPKYRFGVPVVWHVNHVGKEGKQNPDGITLPNRSTVERCNLNNASLETFERQRVMVHTDGVQPKSNTPSTEIRPLLPHNWEMLSSRLRYATLQWLIRAMECDEALHLDTMDTEVHSVDYRVPSKALFLHLVASGGSDRQENETVVGDTIDIDSWNSLLGSVSEEQLDAICLDSLPETPNMFMSSSGMINSSDSDTSLDVQDVPSLNGTIPDESQLELAQLGEEILLSYLDNMCLNPSQQTTSAADATDSLETSNTFMSSSGMINSSDSVTSLDMQDVSNDTIPDIVSEPELVHQNVFDVTTSPFGVVNFEFYNVHEEHSPAREF